MQPEISHRCSSCGASVREANALFCPECGKPLANEQKNESVDEAAKSEATTHAESDGSGESISSTDNDHAPQAEASSQTVSTDASLTEAEVAPAPAAAPSEQATFPAQPSKEPATANITAD